MTYKIPPPPEGRFGKWAYQLWDYVRGNRAGAVLELVGTGPVIVGTGTTGTYTVNLSTSGATAGTYGSANVIPQFAVTAQGLITLGANVGTLGTFAGLTSLVAVGIVTGTTTTGTLTTAQNFLQGSSAAQGNVPVAGTALTTPITNVVGTSTGGTWTLMNWSMPANVLAGVDQALRVTAWGTAQLGLSLIQLLFGGGTALSVSASTGAAIWSIEADIVAMGNGAQRYRSRFSYFTGGVIAGSLQHGTMAVGVSTAVPVTIFGTHAGLNTLAQHGAIIDVRN